jgi:hypothetical protein
MTMQTVTHHDSAAVHAPSGATTWGLERERHWRLLFVCDQAPACSDGVVPEASRRNANRRGDSVLAAAGLGVVEHLVKVNTSPTDRSQPRDPRAQTPGRRTSLDHDDAETLDSSWLLEIEAIAAV